MITIRQSVPQDEPLFYATWLRSQYHGSPWFRDIDQDIFYDNYKRNVAHRLSTSVVRVACLEADPDVIVGYVVLSQDQSTLHWVYVKRAWRKLGIARALVPETVTTHSSITKLGKSILAKHKLTFNPFVL